MNIKPLYDRVIIEPMEQKDGTKFGLVLPESSKQRPNQGTVVALGFGIDFDGNKKDFQVKLGDRVLFNQYAGNEFRHEDKNFIVMREIDIIGVIDEREDN